MRLLIVAGGGGHFAAALSVIEQLPKDWEYKVVGRKYTFEADKTISFEYQTAKKLGIDFFPLTTGRLQRKLSAQTISSFLKMPRGLYQALRLIRTFRPDVVLSFGGYVSVPVGLAATWYHVPIVVHEQILHAGLANKLVSKFARKVCISWKESEKFFPREKIVLTGLPLRKDLLSGRNLEGIASPHSGGARNDKKLPLIYITGGSGGAHGINVLIEGCLPQLLSHFAVVHQTGDSQVYNDYARLVERKKQLPEAISKRYRIEKFIDSSEVGSILEQAALVIARSGMNTVAELLAYGLPCLLIPLPYGQRNEQLTNALFVKKIGLAEVFDQAILTPDELFTAIQTMFAKLESYAAHAIEAKQLIVPDAAARIVEVVKHVAQKTQSETA